MADISEKLLSMKLSLARKFKTVESLVIESKFVSRDVAIVGLYRPPKIVGKNYHCCEGTSRLNNMDLLTKLICNYYR